MPRTKPLTEAARDREAFNHVLDIKRAQAGYKNWSDLADALDVPRDTLYSWKRDPGQIPRRKLRNIYRLLKYTPEDIFDSFGFNNRRTA